MIRLTLAAAWPGSDSGSTMPGNSQLPAPDQRRRTKARRGPVTRPGSLLRILTASGGVVADGATHPCPLESSSEPRTTG